MKVILRTLGLIYLIFKDLQTRVVQNLFEPPILFRGARAKVMRSEDFMN